MLQHNRSMKGNSLAERKAVRKADRAGRGDERFKKIIELYVKPLIHGAELHGPEEWTKELWDVVVFDTIHRLAIAIPDSTSVYVLTRPVPFTEEEKTLVLNIISSVHADAIHASGALHPLACSAVEQALACQLSPEHAETVYAVLQLYNQWAGETHEGKRLLHTIGICPGISRKRTPHIFSLKDMPLAKSLGADNECILTVTGEGSLLGVENVPQKGNMLKKNHEILAPVHMLDIALWTGAGGRIALRLTPDGEILVFKNKMLAFAKRRSRWRCLPHKRLLDELLAFAGSREEADTGLATYLTILDLAFARSGGCLGVLLKGSGQDAAALVSPDMLLASASMSTAASVLKELVDGRRFYELPRKVRKQLCSLDGAVLLDAGGRILTAGAIVKTGGNRLGEGGRSAAAKTLGERGVGFKVSSDGYVEIHLGKRTLPVFA